MDIADRIKLAISQSGIKKSHLAQQLGVSPSAITQWTSGTTKKLEGGNLIAAAKILGVSPAWLATGKGEMTVNKEAVIVDEHPESDFIGVRRVKFKLSAGISGYSVEYLNGHRSPIFFRRDWIEARKLNPNTLFAVEVSGQSMEPSLFAGDIVVVNTADITTADGEVFAANYEGELVVKRLVRNAGAWYCVSDNQDKRRFPDKVCDEHTTLIGRVIYKQSERI